MDSRQRRCLRCVCCHHLACWPAAHQRPTQAYGPDGLGILVIAGIPGLTDLRSNILPQAASLAVCTASKTPLHLHPTLPSRPSPPTC